MRTVTGLIESGQGDTGASHLTMQGPFGSFPYLARQDEGCFRFRCGNHSLRRSMFAAVAGVATATAIAAAIAAGACAAALAATATV